MILTNFQVTWPQSVQIRDIWLHFKRWITKDISDRAFKNEHIRTTGEVEDREEKRSMFLNSVKLRKSKTYMFAL